MPYKESINNANIIYVRITTSTAWATFTYLHILKLHQIETTHQVLWKTQNESLSYMYLHVYVLYKLNITPLKTTLNLQFYKSNV